jgi:hypothetical protein
MKQEFTPDFLVVKPRRAAGYFIETLASVVSLRTERLGDVALRYKFDVHIHVYFQYRPLRCLDHHHAVNRT